MDNIEEFVDERQKSWCIQCGSWILEEKRTTTMCLRKVSCGSLSRQTLPVVKICTTCNNGFSADEEYLFLFLHCVLAGSTEPDRQIDPKAGRTIGGDTRFFWKPETERINRVILKNARDPLALQTRHRIIIN